MKGRPKKSSKMLNYHISRAKKRWVDSTGEVQKVKHSKIPRDSLKGRFENLQRSRERTTWKIGRRFKCPLVEQLDGKGGQSKAYIAKKVHAYLMCNKEKNGTIGGGGNRSVKRAFPESV